MKMYVFESKEVVIERPENSTEPVSSVLATRFPESDTLSTVSGPASRNPALVYLARLAPSSRRTMRTALDKIAAIATGDRCNAEMCPWGALRYRHTQAITAAMVARYAPRTANLHLAALRCVIREAWRLGCMSAEDYHLAVDIGAVKVETLPAGREVKPSSTIHKFRPGFGRPSTPISAPKKFECALHVLHFFGTDLDVDCSPKNPGRT